MTNWDDEKAEARRSLQDAFGDAAADYTPEGGGDAVSCTVRLIQTSDLTGDLDREGYARMHIDKNIAVFTRSDFTGADPIQPLPTRGGTVTLADGRSFFLEFDLPDDGVEIISFVVDEQT